MRWLVLSVALFFAGCASGPVLTPLCRDDAFTAAMLFQRAGYPVRIAYGPVNGANALHVQAQARIAGEWTPVGMFGGVATVEPPDAFFTVTEYKRPEFLLGVFADETLEALAR
jgi:hypothetical protein